MGRGKGPNRSAQTHPAKVNLKKNLKIVKMCKTKCLLVSRRVFMYSQFNSTTLLMTSLNYLCIPLTYNANNCTLKSEMT